MPYITPQRRQNLQDGDAAMTPGELTYLLTDEIASYLNRFGVSYGILAEVLGSLEGAKLDLERRIVTPYEQTKQEENGDVWDPELLAAANGRE